MSRAVLIALLLALGAPAGAWAEDELVGNPPSQDDVVAQPTPPPADTSPPAPPPVDAMPADAAPPETAAVDPAAAWEQHQARRERGRTNLILGQMIHGTALGIELATIATPVGQEIPPETLLGAGGAGFLTGFVLPFLLFPDGIEPGHAAALNSGPVWGFLLGYTAARTNYSIRGRGRLGVATLTQLAGLGAGELAWQLFEPTRGQVTLVDTVAFWTGTLATLALVIEANWDFPQPRPVVAATHFWSIGAGLAAGGVLASVYPDVRGDRLMFMNLGGVLGGAMLPAMIAIAVGGIDERAAALVAIGGIGLGMGLTYLGTQGMARRPRAASVSLRLGPTLDGGATIGLGGEF